jgi:hypothetical protein
VKEQKIFHPHITPIPLKIEASMKINNTNKKNNGIVPGYPTNKVEKGK